MLTLSGGALKTSIPEDYSQRIKLFRTKFGLTQARLAELVGVACASVNRWENGQTKPTAMAWRKMERAEVLGLQALEDRPLHKLQDGAGSYAVEKNEPDLDFSAPPDVVLTITEGHRLAFGYQTNPAFASETSLIDPLPHQRIAVYEHMLPQARLRFLLADDAGAGKTIMTGLYIREMLARRLIQRVLVVPPAGLVGNWERELRTLFSLPFQIVSGADARNGNPFTGSDSQHVIVSIDTLAGERVFSRLQESQPYDLVIFDEAHKLSADREADFRVRKTDRYLLAEALAGIHSDQARWRLHWSARHLILLTATPHMGKDYPYYCLWRLLEPRALSTIDAFNAFPPDARRRHSIRRTKEEMVYFDGRKIYPKRVSDTLSYALTQGAVSEQAVYDRATRYIKHYYNRARILNRSAARLTMSVFQRRLASSTWALICSLERRLERLQALAEDIRSGKITAEQLKQLQKKLDQQASDTFEDMTPDEESSVDGSEENEVNEIRALAGVVAVSLEELEAECEQVEELLTLAKDVYEQGHESKFDRLVEALRDDRFCSEKVLIFTEHRDTLNFLVRRLEGMGFAGEVAQIHGGMAYPEREEQVDFFRKPIAEGGARYLVATDAAGEGINLQVCWLMVNYDIPWNPARLEQRMGRIHRYGQKHDPVIILNLVAGGTREGRVMRTLLEKLERIRDQLGSDKVFDVVGRLFEGVSLRAYMERVIEEGEAAAVEREMEARLTRERLEAIDAEERSRFGAGGDIQQALPRLSEDLERETYRRLLPGYMHGFLKHALPLVDLAMEDQAESTFSLLPLKPGALDPLWPVLESYPAEKRMSFTLIRPGDSKQTIFVHPGEPLYEALWGNIASRFSRQALAGCVFVDPTVEEPYLFHLAEVSVIRQADPACEAFTEPELLETRLVGLRESRNGEMQVCPVESLLLLRGGAMPIPIPPAFLSLAASARDRKELVKRWVQENILRPAASSRRQTLFDSLPEKESFLARGFAFQESELATMRTRYRTKADSGDSYAKAELPRIRERQRMLSSQRDMEVATLRREPELIQEGEITFLAHALVIPSDDPEERQRHDAAVEAVAMQVAMAYEQAAGAVVKDVHTPDLSRAAGLGDYPGFDLLSYRSNGEVCCIEVKGRAQRGNIDISENEWDSAHNRRKEYWLYVVYDCAIEKPRLLRIPDPWGKLVAKVRGYTLQEQELTVVAED